MRTSHALLLIAGFGSLVAAIGVGCGAAKSRVIIDDDAGATEPPMSFGDGGDAAKACSGLQCQQAVCLGGKDTTVTGKVYAPNGKLALYNAIVYVPNAEPEALTKGATCDQCGAVTGEPIVTALTDPTGSFELKNVPSGKDIPLVIQIGKWRRQVVIPEVKACEENELTDSDLTRLPKNQSEGDMPRIALTSGGCDNLGCMLPKVGIDSSEFGVEGDGPSKSVHVYLGAGGNGPSGAGQAQTFWSDAEKMKQYDMLILSCECQEALTNKGGTQGGPAFAAMTEYLNAGGRIFTTDFMYTWYRYSPDEGLKSATSMRGGAPGGGSPMTIDSSFPKGKALQDWLASAAGVAGGKVTADAIFSNVISNDPAKSQQWATSGAGFGGTGGQEPRVFSVNVPVGVPVEQQCGKGVHIDAHVNTSGGDTVGASYPNSCNSPLKPAENLLSFFFFDLASCIQDEGEPPKPPPVK